jgi:hypothetical protein
VKGHNPSGVVLGYGHFTSSYPTNNSVKLHFDSHAISAIRAGNVFDHTLEHNL